MPDATYQLSLKETFKLAWDKVDGTKSTIFGSVLFATAFAVGLFILNDILLSAFPDLSVFVQRSIGVALEFVTFLLQVGLVYIGINRAKDLPISFNLLFYGFEKEKLGNLIVLYLLQVAMLATPTLLLAMYFLGTPAFACIAIFIAVFYLSIRIGLAFAFVVDQNVAVRTAIKLSFRATRGNFWQFTAYTLTQVLILILCAIPLGIGLIWGAPLTLICYGIVYKNLSENNLAA